MWWIESSAVLDIAGKIDLKHRNCPLCREEIIWDKNNPLGKENSNLVIELDNYIRSLWMLSGAVKLHIREFLPLRNSLDVNVEKLRAWTSDHDIEDRVIDGPILAQEAFHRVEKGFKNASKAS
jgi:hypothetical protein